MFLLNIMDGSVVLQLVLKALLMFKLTIGYKFGNMKFIGLLIASHQVSLL